MINADESSAMLDLTSWRFRVNRLGFLRNAGEIEFKPLTLVCGPNNTGKTWALYAVYGFLADSDQYVLPDIDKLANELIRKGQITWDFGTWLTNNTSIIIDAINKHFTNRLQSIFNYHNAGILSFYRSIEWIAHSKDVIDRAIDRPLDFRLTLGTEKNETLRIIKNAGEQFINLTIISDKLPDLPKILSGAIAGLITGIPAKRSVLLAPAERNGLHLFFRELTNRRASLIQRAVTNYNSERLLLKLLEAAISQYSLPISDYIDWLNTLSELHLRAPGHYHQMATDLIPLIGGQYDIDNDGNIHFYPTDQPRLDQTKSPAMELHLTSSTVKSLFGLWAYLQYAAKPGDLLMIDEPELNLHPGNQRKLARLLCKMINNGLRVIISTHSDYIVREINSMIMLSKPGTVQHTLMERFGYSEDEILSPDKVAAWLFSNQTISAMPIDAEEGINASTFDEQIHDLNETSDAIFYAYRDGEI